MSRKPKAPRPALDEIPGVTKEAVDGFERPEVSPISPADELCTDLGNARRLVRQHGADLRWTRATGWLAWDGTRWKRDDTQAVQHRATLAAMSLFEEARQTRDRALQRKLIVIQARKSSPRSRRMPRSS
jgi:hypothetical protein